ncbi:hypothetical protein/hypothetical protein [Streptomyces sp. DvalAA-14]|nr:nickel insertion protein [Streptomyces sp. SID4948]SCD67459.1 hypothetical protein/hypothetical protein [Streptomyces sp. DvalAA-14]
MGARYEPFGPMTLGRTGYGAGTRTMPDRPNVAAVTLATAVRSGVRHLYVLETNLDDVTGETLAHVLARALEHGALDAWVTPAVMKKGRPAHVVHLLRDPERADGLQELLAAETGTLGIRRSAVERAALPRRTEVVDVDGVGIRVKHGPYRSKPEYDDLAAAARRLGLPLRAVADRAVRRADPSDGARS